MSRKRPPVPDTEDKSRVADRYRSATFELLRWAKAVEAAGIVVRASKVRVPAPAYVDLRDAVALVATLPLDIPVTATPTRRSTKDTEVEGEPDAVIAAVQDTVIADRGATIHA